MLRLVRLKGLHLMYQPNFNSKNQLPIQLWWSIPKSKIEKKIKIDGTGIDLGAKSKNAKYYEYFNLEKVTHIDFVDYFSG